MLEARRWATLVLVIIPLLPVAVTAVILGAIVEIFCESFKAGRAVFSPWDGFSSRS